MFSHTEVATFAAVFIALYVAHSVGDHWVQSSHQAAAKGGRGWPARLACAGHVASLGVAPSASQGSPAIAQFCGMRPWTVGVRQVSQTEAVAR